jgi:hypothetical protein
MLEMELRGYDKNQFTIFITATGIQIKIPEVGSGIHIHG